MPERIGLYPGTFDPITAGHLDIIQRACRSVDKLIVGVAMNAGKNPLFSLEERAEMVRGDLADLHNPFGAELEVRAFDGLLVQFAQDCGATQLFRGLRAVSDFEYEFQMAGMNRNLHPDVETVFLTPGEQHMFVSATIVREIARFGGDVTKFVPPSVAKRLAAKLQ